MPTTTATASFFAFFAIFLVLTLFGTSDAFVPNDSRAAITSTAEAFAESRSDPTSLAIGFTNGSASPTVLRMGLFDSVLSKFRNNSNNGEEEEGDFVRLDEMSQQFLGPGPAILMCQIPNGIDDDEIRDMLADGAPTATSKGISIARIPFGDNGNDDDPNRSLVDLSLGEALETVIKRPPRPPEPPRLSVLSAGQPSPEAAGATPVVIFSGFERSEMMDSYNILGPEIFQETASCYGRGQYLACATAVPNAMGKPLGQVLGEISGDHADAMKNRQQPPDDN